jgi:density-regulated protein
MVQAAGTSKDGVDAADAALGDLSVGDKPDAGAEKNDKEKKSSKTEKAKTIVIKVEKRGGKKMNTLIIGLDDFGVDLKDAAKIMKKKFACGCGVSKNADNRFEVEIQGSFIGEAARLLVGKDFDVPRSAIVINVSKKKQTMDEFEEEEGANK